MKKFIYIGLVCLSLIIVFSLIILNNKNEDKNFVHVSVGEVTHSAFYAPFYVAIENGYFEEEGIKVDLSVISGANNVVAAVLSGDVNIGFCGLEATVYVYNGGEKDYIQSFAGLTKRDGQFIVSREKIDNFDWNMLKGEEVLAGRVGGMPLLNFLNALKNTDINKNDVNVNTSVDFANLTSAFLSGSGDFVNLFEPNATKLENMHLGYIVSSVGEKSGEMPYTAFNARKSYIEKNGDVVERFTRAIARGLEYTKMHEPSQIADIIISQFPDTSILDLTTIIKRYKEADTWLDNPLITESMFKNLEDVIISSGEIQDYVPFSELINNKY